MYEDILLKYYSLAVWFVGKKKKSLYDNGAAFLFSNLILFCWVTLLVFILSLLPFKVGMEYVGIILLTSAYLIFYGFVKKNIISRLNEKSFKQRYNDLDHLTQRKYAWVALLLLIASFYFLHFVLYSRFNNYFL